MSTPTTFGPSRGTSMPKPTTLGQSGWTRGYRPRKERQSLRAREYYVDNFKKDWIILGVGRKMSPRTGRFKNHLSFLLPFLWFFLLKYLSSLSIIPPLLLLQKTGLSER